MRYLILFFALLSCSDPFEVKPINLIETEIQNTPVLNEEDHEVVCFFHPEEMPQFPGGMTALYAFIQENLKWSSTRTCVEGKVFVMFVVDVDGSIENLEIAKGIGDEFDNAALKVFERMPNWIPGKINGQPTKTKMIFPITFTFR